MSDWKLKMFNEWGIAGLYVVGDDEDFPVAKICDQYRRLPTDAHDVLAKVVPDELSTMANAQLIASSPKMRDKLEDVSEVLSKLLKAPTLTLTTELYNEIEKQVSEITKMLKELEVNDPNNGSVDLS